MYDVIIIGSGPAGISAALYTVRSKLKTLIIGKNDSVLRKADTVENYYGFEKPISGMELLDNGIKQARRIGADIIEEEVVAISQEGEFEVITSTALYKAKAVLIATGQPQKKIKIENLDSFEGRGVSYCTTCDGFFYNNLKVGVVGSKDFALHEAIELETFTRDITIFTNGEELTLSDNYRQGKERYKIDTRKITKLEGQDFLQSICFEDGSCEAIDGLFIANESASSVDFARKLGISVKGNNILVDREQQTNIPGLFAAGDCTGGFKQISTAVGEGALAGKKIIEYVRNADKV